MGIEQEETEAYEDDIDVQTKSFKSVASLLDAHGFLAPSSPTPDMEITHEEEAEQDSAFIGYGQ